MKTKYKNVEFENRGVNAFACYTLESDFLGEVVKTADSEFVYESAQDSMIHEAAELRDIADFLDQLNKGDSNE